jgi:hypothetical protein
MMAGWRAQMEKAAQTMNPEDVMKTIFPAGTDGLADMQKAFWSSFTGTSKKS